VLGRKTALEKGKFLKNLWDPPKKGCSVFNIEYENENKK
jgi:hypothetical protein